MDLKERAREVADELLWVALKMDPGATNGEYIRVMQPLILAFGESVRAQALEDACRAVYQPDEKGRRLDTWTAEFAEQAIRRALGEDRADPEGQFYKDCCDKGNC